MTPTSPPRFNARTTPYQQALGARVRQLRLAKGWSGADLARRLGVQRAYVCKIEKGAVLVSAPVLACLADALGCSTDTLLGRHYHVAPIVDDLIQAGSVHQGVLTLLLMTEGERQGWIAQQLRHWQQPGGNP